MFTIKFKTADGSRCRIFEAESFTVLRSAHPYKAGPYAEVTMHFASGTSERIDLHDPRRGSSNDPVIAYHTAFIENAAGRTTEVIRVGSAPVAPYVAPPMPEEQLAGFNPRASVSGVTDSSGWSSAVNAVGHVESKLKPDPYTEVASY